MEFPLRPSVADTERLRVDLYAGPRHAWRQEFPADYINRVLLCSLLVGLLGAVRCGEM